MSDVDEAWEEFLDIGQDLNIDTIYHLAAQSAGEPSYDNPKFDILTNSYGTYLITKFCKHAYGAVKNMSLRLKVICSTYKSVHLSKSQKTSCCKTDELTTYL